MGMTGPSLVGDAGRSVGLVGSPWRAPNFERNITMRATIIHGAGDIRVETVPDPKILEPTDALVRVAAACICGSDLWPYRSMPASEAGSRIGHEFLGVVEDVGADVAGFAAGDLVVAPFVWSDGTCDFCREGLQTSCRHGGLWGRGRHRRWPGRSGPGAPGRRHAGEAARGRGLGPPPVSAHPVGRVPHRLPLRPHGRGGPRTTVTVIGDGAVGLSAVLSAKRLGAERIILMGRHQGRTDLGLEFGATDIVSERGEEGVERVRELTGGDGTHTVLECVGLVEAISTAFGVVRDGGTVSRVGAPQYQDVPMPFPVFMRNVTLTGGVAPARAYIDELLPDVLEGRSRARSSTLRSAWTRWPTATGRWPGAPPSRCSSSPDQNRPRTGRGTVGAL